MSLLDVNLKKELKEKEKDLTIDIIKEESTKDISTKYKISSDNNNISSNLDLPLFSTSNDNIDYNVPQSILNLSKNQFIEAFKSNVSTKQLQKNLVGISKENIDKIINELTGIFSTIIKDKNGNYFCSNLIRICSQEQRLKILKELSSTINQDCNDEYGTHPIQNLIKFASSEEEFKLILSSFNDFNNIILASMNQYGTYVIQKIFEHIPESLRTDFNSIFVKFSCFLSRDIYGVSTIKKFIANTKNECIVNTFINLIISNFMNISDNKYGNYLIQYLLEKWWNKKEGQLFKYYIISKFNILMEHTYSSYVCNFYLKLCSNKEKALLIQSLNNYNNKKKNALLNKNKNNENIDYDNH